MVDMPVAESYVVPAPQRTVVPVAGGGVFPVRRIYCVGRNYAAHVREMGGNEREPPFFFQKPTDSIVLNGSVVSYPTATTDLQHEVELVLAIGSGGRDISVEAARNHVFGVAVGIDLTRRDLQLKARDTGRPWEGGKSFDASAPISNIHPLGTGPIPATGRISLSVNGVVKQDGRLEEMIWSSAEIVSQLSRLYVLAPGDLIFTGTPAGVGKLQSGDRVEALVSDVDTLAIQVR